MKVYYEKPDAVKLLKQAIELAENYENATGKKPNRITMTKEEFKSLESYLVSFKGYAEVETNQFLNGQIYGMEIIIND